MSRSQPERAGPAGAHTLSGLGLPGLSTNVSVKVSFCLTLYWIYCRFVPRMAAAASAGLERLLRNPKPQKLNFQNGPNYVAVRFPAASLNTELMAFARVPNVAIAAKESKTSRSAYSVKSWPSSSFHKRIMRFFIGLSSQSIKYERRREVPL